MKNYIKFYLLLLSLLTGKEVLGQCPAFPGGSMVQGRFTLNGVAVTGVDTNPLVICTGSRITALNPPAANQAGFKICYTHTDGSVNVATTPLGCSESSGVQSLPYAAGTYGVIITGTANASPFYACKVVKVVNAEKPVFSALSCPPTPPGSILLTLVKDPANIYSNYDLDWGVGNPSLNIPFNNFYNAPATATTLGTTFHAYPTGTTTATLILTGRITGLSNCTTKSDPVTISVVSTIVPTISQVEVQDDKTVAVTYRSQINVKAQVVQRTNTVTPATYNSIGSPYTPATQVTTSVITVGGLDTKTQMALNVKVTPLLCTESYGALDVPTVVLKVEAQNKKNVLTWGAVAGALRFEVYRTDSGLLVGTLGANTLTYTDANITCNQNYTYYVRAVMPGTIYSISQKLTVKAISKDIPPAINDIVVSIEAGTNTIRWLKPTNFDVNAKYIVVYRSENDPAGPYNRIDSVQYKGVTTYADVTTADDINYCYKVGFNDKCGNTSVLSVALCPMHLNLKADNLAWTPYIQFTNGLRDYQVKKKFYNTSGVLDAKNYPVGNSLGWKIEDDPNDASQQVLFYIEATSNVTNLSSKSNEVLYTKSARIFIPEVFTPNGDPHNEKVEIKGLYLTRVVSIYIYDRWGNTIYYGSHFDDAWDGRLQTTNSPAPEGTYIYKVVVEDQIGNILTKEGSILLVR